jgi:hypothetical protein
MQEYAGGIQITFLKNEKVVENLTAHQKQIIKSSKVFLTLTNFFFNWDSTFPTCFFSIFGKSFSTNSNLKLSGRFSTISGLSII